MTDDEADNFYKRLLDFYGKRLACYETHPMAFAFQVKMFKYFES